ncbi:MAG: hypothetical protein K0S55_321 [Clostridia bacterium]|jgi:hypothetical protein|nr:hypothetical protein [Clostridia bacterium]
MIFKNFIPATEKRVEQNTDKKINEGIRNKTIKRLQCFKNCDNELTSDRIKKLKHEWDTERVLEANAAALVVISTILGFKNRYWLLLTGTVGIFLLNHAIKGWCPPVPLIRKMGIRTTEEINNERVALKILRGDFAEKEINIQALFKIAEKD